MGKKARTPRRFRVYVLLPSGKCTRGRYYNKPRSAWNRRRELLAQLTERHRVIIFNQHGRIAVSDCHGWGGKWTAEKSIFNRRLTSDVKDTHCLDMGKAA